MIAIKDYARERKFQVIDFLRILEEGRASAAVNVRGERVHTDYRLIRRKTQDTAVSQIPVLVLTGWGSGWEGTAPLAFSLYAEGHDMLLWSIPGYGNSENPPKDFCEYNFFGQTAQILCAFLQTIGIPEVHLVGHSMAGPILAYFASNYDKFAKSLTLLSPSGALEYSGWIGKACLMANFSISGARLRREAKREQRNIEPWYDYLRPLIDLCGKQKSPFFDWRLRRATQRWYEFKELSERNLGENLSGISCPILAILGSLDTVFPAQFSEHEIRVAMSGRGYSGKTLQIKILSGMHHNPTLYRPEATAQIISEFIKEL